MKFIIKHEISGRLRIHLHAARLTCREADHLQACLEAAPSVTRGFVPPSLRLGCAESAVLNNSNGSTL